MQDEDACLDRTTFDQIRNENSDERSAEGGAATGDGGGRGEGKRMIASDSSENGDDSSLSPGKRTRNHKR